MEARAQPKPFEQVLHAPKQGRDWTVMLVGPRISRDARLRREYTLNIPDTAAIILQRV